MKKVVSPIQIDQLSKRTRLLKMIQEQENSRPLINDQIDSRKIYVALRTMADLIRIHDVLLLKIEEVKDIIKNNKGEPGIPGATPSESELKSMIADMLPDTEDYIYLIESLMPEVEDGEAPTKEYLLELIASVMPSVPDTKEILAQVKKMIPKKVEIDIDLIASKAAKKIKPKKTDSISMKDVEAYLGSLEKPKITVKDIEDLDKLILNIRNEMRRATGYKMRGGGDTVLAGTGIAVTPNTVGAKVISAPGSPGTAVYEESLTGSGTSFTLAHTPIAGTLRLYRGGARQRLGDDYTLAGAIVTLAITKPSSELAIVDYNY